MVCRRLPNLQHHGVEPGRNGHSRFGGRQAADIIAAMSVDQSNSASLSDEVVRGFFAFQPALAQNAGDHRFDGQTGDFSAGSVARRVAELERQTAALGEARTATRTRRPIG